MFTTNQLKFLAISSTEKKILLNIKIVPKTIFAIHQSTKIPRATLYLVIKKLYSRGFIRAKMDGKRYLYQTIPLKTLKSKLQEIAESL
jgi:sugar-specific transcriptional regulator TrmB